MGRTVGDVLHEISGGKPEDLVNILHRWPPDLFAATSSILQESGAYRSLVSPPGASEWPPQDASSWCADVAALAAHWVEWCEDHLPPVAERVSTPVTSRIKAFFAAILQLDLDDLALEANWGLLAELLALNAIADEACAGLGLGSLSPDGSAYRLHASGQLTDNGTLSSLPRERLRVLPKTRTPQSGISIRSLSHHVCSIRGEVGVTWRRRDFPKRLESDRLRMLLFPWPLRIVESDFVPVDGPLKNLDTTKYGFFAFQPSYDSALLYDTFERVLRNASAAANAIDMVVLPECAVTEAEFDELWKRCCAGGVHVLLAGVRTSVTNEARLRVGVSNPTMVLQHKHHRWCLDEAQIASYDIGGALSPARRWWESMGLPRRELTFIAFNDWLTLCHLICEDLARTDPVAHVIRAVGPTLLVALLLDGPQLGERWSARYASILAEDPGTSVLTLTALGMALRGSRPNRTIGFWRDANAGGRPIVLEDGAEAAVLTVWAQRLEEFTADGRTDHGLASRIIYGGLAQVRGT
jgi:hypothetical protein